MEVRQASSNEVEAARLLTNASWLATYPALIGEEATRQIMVDRHSPDVFRAQFATTGTNFLVALDGDRVLGHCHAYDDDGHYVDRLHVDPNTKGQGVGRAMLQSLEASLPSGARLWLDVLLGNDAAMGFYERVGFKRVGETDACGGLNGIPAVIFEKRVEGEKS